MTEIRKDRDVTRGFSVKPKCGGEVTIEKGAADYDLFVGYVAAGSTFTWEASEDGRTWRWTGISPKLDAETGRVTFTLPSDGAVLVPPEEGRRVSIPYGKDHS
jgi:hypothetical protein